MAENNLNTLFRVQNEIEALNEKIDALKKEEKALLGLIIKSGTKENRYYRLEASIRAGNRSIQIVLLKEKYPELAPKLIKETVTVTDAKKVLGDEAISEISIKAPDIVSYKAVKKGNAVIEA